MSRSRVSDEHCENHRSKKAHFVKEIDGGCLYFCEKCAIALASQGHTICRVSEGPVGHVGASQRQSTRSPAKQSLSHLPNSRECEISTFVAKLKQLCSTIDSKREQIRDNLLASE